MPDNVLFPASVLQNPLVVAAATILISTGIAAGITYSGTNNGANIHEWHTQATTSTGVVVSTRLVARMSSSGTLVLSGAVKAKGALSGASLTLNVGVGGGKGVCYQTGGQLSYCQGPVDSKGCACK